MNKIILIGNVTKDPKLEETASGVSVCKFSIAVNRDYKKDGERETDFFNVVCWREKAEVCAQYLKKGNKAAITGRLENRTYEGNDGVKRTVTDIIAEGVEFLTPKENVTVSPARSSQTRALHPPPTLSDVFSIISDNKPIDSQLFFA